MMDLSQREAETSLESTHNVYQVTTNVCSVGSLNSWRNAKISVGLSIGNFLQISSSHFNSICIVRLSQYPICCCFEILEKWLLKVYK